MFRSARHRSPITPRWVRGLLAGAFLAFLAFSNAGCTLGALSYVYRDMSPLHVTGWSIAWPILPSQSGYWLAGLQRRNWPKRWLAADDARERHSVPYPIPSQPERLQANFRKLTVFRPVTLGFPQGRWPIVKA